MISDPYEKQLHREIFNSSWYKADVRPITNQIQAYMYNRKDYGYGLGGIDVRANDFQSTTTSYGGKTKTATATNEVSASDFYSIEKDRFSPTPFQKHEVTYPVHTELPEPR